MFHTSKSRRMWRFLSVDTHTLLLKVTMQIHIILSDFKYFIQVMLIQAEWLDLSGFYINHQTFIQTKSKTADNKLTYFSLGKYKFSGCQLSKDGLTFKIMQGILQSSSVSFFSAPSFLPAFTYCNNFSNQELFVWFKCHIFQPARWTSHTFFLWLVGVDN